MRICFFGTYTLDEGYPVNRMILRALHANGVEVVECHERLWQHARERWSASKWYFSISFWLHAFKTYLKLIIKYYRIGQFDLITVGYLGHHDIFLARLLNLWKRRPVVLVAFNSLYETVVLDRKLYSERHPVGRFLYWLDRTACRLADLVLLDTQAHIDYFVQEFRLDSSRFFRAFVGSDLALFETDPHQKTKIGRSFEVLFVGTYIPLHGIETILCAAKILENEPTVQFTLIGQGQLYPYLRQMANELRLNRLRFITDWISLDDLAQYISEADICLGIFGKGEKAARVIPCKVFDSLVMSKPLITADTLAARELLVNKENALLCPPGDERALAGEILELMKDNELRDKIGKSGHTTYLKSCTPEAVGKSLVHAFENLTQ
jgi:glycosyltransferase involved in cell wall biosynthesis